MVNGVHATGNMVNCGDFGPKIELYSINIIINYLRHRILKLLIFYDVMEKMVDDHGRGMVKTVYSLHLPSITT
jgi:hypothetical protein